MANIEPRNTDPKKSRGSTESAKDADVDQGRLYRDRLIAAIYEAASNPHAYWDFVRALSKYLELSAVKSWKIGDLSEIDIGVLEADRGLALHFENLNKKLESAPDRIIPGSLRERISQRPGIAVLIDEHGKVASSSQEARTALNGAALNPSQLSQMLHAEDAVSLRRALTEHVIHKRAVAPRILRGDGFHIIVRTLRRNFGNEDFLCLETLAVDWSSDVEAVLTSSFKLTTAELRVLKELVGGETVKCISRRYKRSEGTIRNQIKSLLAKTSAGNLANLNRIVALIADNIAGGPKPTSLLSGASTSLDIITLSDGRTLEVRLQGPPDGSPVLFIHGMLFGSELPKSTLECLEKYRLRLIAPARPNFGMSDPSPGLPDHEPDRFVDDLVSLLDHYGVDRTICLTNITGSVYGYALAAKAPSRVAGLVNAASIVPVLKAKQFVSMPPTQRLLSFLMRFMPALLPPLFQSGIAQIRASGEIPFFDTLYERGSCDHLITQRTDLSDLMKRSLHFATDQGYVGAFTDTFHIVRDWSSYANRVCTAGLPSIHVHGLMDPQYGFDDVAEFTKRFENIQLRGVENAGQLLLFQEPEPVFQAVAELLT
ncbi:alpha/beta hydrolase [Lutimaribacter saemankumensis]|nr:alpha/beta hydrolase [Lutimaribacter saemankumensis]